MQSIAKQLCNFAVLNTASFRVSHTTTELLLNAQGKKEGVSLLLESSGLTKSQKGYQDQDAKVPRPTDRKRSSCDWTGILGTAATRAYDIPIRGQNCNTLQPGVGPYQYLQRCGPRRRHCTPSCTRSSTSTITALLRRRRRLELDIDQRPVPRCCCCNAGEFARDFLEEALHVLARLC